MRDKILNALRSAGHGLTPNKLAEAIKPYNSEVPYLTLLLLMEESRELFLHRADGSAGTHKNEIVLVSLRHAICAKCEQAHGLFTKCPKG